MKSFGVVLLLAFWNVEVFSVPSIKWKCLDAFNKFRSDAAVGKLNNLIHNIAEKSMDDKVKGYPDLDESNRQKSLKILQMKVGPMANVKKLIWDEELEKSANRTGQTCPQIGGKRGEKYREFSLYYSTSAKEDLKETITENLNFMAPWMISVMPPDVNTTLYYYVAGEFFWATRERIGCAIVKCGDRKLLECHMAPGNTLEGTPFIEGKPCSKCEDGYVCENELCTRERIMAKGEKSSSAATNHWIMRSFFTSIPSMLYFV
ncbi:unnamed protein product [Caenorhabditis sp. 36 PRJEB53466]|nr:unnamed protein product [Caenorhabditis sp. 36 PRJEB53466]